MWPHDIIIGPAVFNGYGLMMALGAALGLFSLKFSAPPAGTTFTEAFNLAFQLIIAGLAGARLAYVITHLRPFISHPAEILMYWRGGLMFQGGLLGGLFVAMILAAKGRIRLLVMGDALAPGLALGQGVGRLGCLLAGCCYGLPAPPWLGITFPSSSQAPWGTPLYPTQAMEAAALIILGAGLLSRLKKAPSSAMPANAATLLPPASLPQASPAALLPPAPSPEASPAPNLACPPGRIMALYLIWSGLIRLLMEFFRGDDRGPRVLMNFRMTGLAALMILTAGLGLWLYLHRRPRSFRRHRFQSGPR